MTHREWTVPAGRVLAAGLLGLVLLLSLPAHALDAVPTLVLDEQGELDLVARGLSVDGDPAGTEDQRYPAELRTAWVATSPGPVRPMYGSRWLVARLVNPPGTTAATWTLRMNTDPLYLPHLVVLDGDRVVSLERRDSAVAIGVDTGPAIAVGQRFALSVPPGESRVVALRVSAIGYGSLTADILSAEHYVNWAARHQAVVMTALGLLMAVGVYNLLLGIGIRSSTYVWYAIHAGSHLAYWATLYGLTADLAGFTDHDRLVYKLSSSVTFLAAPFFVRGLLVPKTFAPRLDRMLVWCGWAGLALLIPTVALIPWPEPHRAWVRGPEYQFLLALIETPLFLLTGWLALRHRVAGAVWFLVGWGTYLAAILSLVFATYGVWRFTGDWLLLGLLSATWEAVMLSQALAGRIKAIHHARLESEARLAAQEGLLAAVSHELRTPLNAILGMARLLDRETLPQRAHRRVQAILRAGETLLGMVSNLLDRASLDAGQLQLTRTPAEIGTLIGESCGLMGDLATAKGLEIVANVDPALPDWAVMDGTRVKQVLIGLIDNAVKYTEAGRIEVAAARGAGRRVEFSVTDSGRGIPVEERERIFSRFQRGHASSVGGAGLGLAIARDLVAAMGGQLAVTDAPGGGARFAFDIALDPAPPPAATRACGLTILLVDDMEVNREVAAALLRSEGHTTLTAAPEDAVAMLNAHAVDAVILDVNMPGLDGPDLAKMIRALPDPAKAGVAILALSAGVQSVARVRLGDLGVTEFLPKPLKPAEMHAALARATANRTAPVIA